jgi:hypothetical protein
MASLYKLKDSELHSAYIECVSWVRLRLDLPGTTYATLASELTVGESALKQFIHRAGDLSTNRTNVRRGATFERIYSAMKRDPGDKIEVPDDRKLSPAMKSFFYGNFLKMIGSGEEIQREASQKVFNNHSYMCYRNATSCEYIVISEIVFTEIKSDHGIIWEFEHFFEDNDGQKKSDGIAFALHNTIYLIGDISEGNGLDIIRIGMPQKEDVNFLIAFIESIDDKRQPFIANAILLPTHNVEENGHIDISSLDLDADTMTHVSMRNPGILPKYIASHFHYDNFSNFGAKMLKQLSLEDAKNTLSIRKKYMIPGILDFHINL